MSAVEEEVALKEASSARHANNYCLVSKVTTEHEKSTTVRIAYKVANQNNVFAMPKEILAEMLAELISVDYIDELTIKANQPLFIYLHFPLDTEKEALLRRILDTYCRCDESL